VEVGNCSQWVLEACSVRLKDCDVLGDVATELGTVQEEFRLLRPPGNEKMVVPARQRGVL
jgi:hypothetical protein